MDKKKLTIFLLSVCCTTNLLGCAFIPEKVEKKSVNADSGKYQIPTIQELQEAGIDISAVMDGNQSIQDLSNFELNVDLVADKSPYTNRHIAGSEESYLQPVYDYIDGTFMCDSALLFHAFPSDYMNETYATLTETEMTIDEYHKFLDSILLMAVCMEQETYDLISKIDYDIVSATKLTDDDLVAYMEIYCTSCEEVFGNRPEHVEITDGYCIEIKFNQNLAESELTDSNIFNVYEMNGTWVLDIAMSNL